MEYQLDQRRFWSALSDLYVGAPGNIYLKAANVQKLGSANLDTPVPPLPAGYAGGYTLKDEAQVSMPFSRYRITTASGEVFNGATDKDGQTMSVHTAMPEELKFDLPESEKWISFSAPAELDYADKKCTATMDDGTVLQGTFDSENKAGFYSFFGSSCVKLEMEPLCYQQTVSSAVERILNKTSEQKT